MAGSRPTAYPAAGSPPSRRRRRAWRGITVYGIEPYDPAAFRAQAAAALTEAAAGRLEPVIGQTFPLGRAADAHAAIEARATVAKTLLLTGVITA